MSLVELHRHLDGSLRPATVRELASALGLSVPSDLLFVAGMGLHEALSRFAFTLSLLQDPASVRRVAHEMCEDAAAEGISALEIRFAPQLHGGEIDRTVNAAIEGIAGRAGLILCGLYGEPPEVLESLVDVASSRPGVVGLDLAGGPVPGSEWGMKDYAGAFRRAAEVGLGRTVHAGEGRPATEIREAIEVLGAERIGHGASLLEDEELVRLVVERGITIEACPTSNVHTGLFASVSEHPLGEWLRRGVRVTVCTDNTLLSDVVLPEEHRRVLEIPGVGAEELARMNDYGHDAIFQRML